MLTLQVTFPFIYHQAIKKFCDGKTVKKPDPSLVPPGQKIAFSFSGDAERFHFELPVNFRSDIFVYSSPYD
jgi:hypothetical protein